MFIVRVLQRSLAVCALFAHSARASHSFAEAAAQASSKEPEVVPGELIVKFHPGIALQNQSELLASIGAGIIYRFSGMDALHLSVPNYVGVTNVLELSKWISNQPGVAFAEPNYVVHAFENHNIPNDTLFSELWALQNKESQQKPVADIGATTAWTRSTGSRRVVVAVIDSGIDYSHEDIRENYWSNPGETGLDFQGRDKRTNGVDDDGNGYVDDWRGWDFANNDNDPMDDNSHGTHCAGTIGALGNNNVGVVGVNWHVSLLGIKFLKGDGSGDTAGAIKAIEYATSLGIPILSNSWGGAPYSEALKDTIEQAAKKDILFVAAAGNNSNDIDLRPTYPASYNIPNIVSVSATDSRDEMAKFSNYGKSTVHLAAPGVDILSTVPDNKYEKLSGTSMATPHVAGAAALIKSMYPKATARLLKDKITNSVDIIRSQIDKTISNGRLNIGTAMEEDTMPPSPPSSLTIVKRGGTMVQLAWNASGDDGDLGRAKTYEIRISSKPITCESAWNSAIVPKQMIKFSEKDDTIRATVSDLPFSYQGWFAVKAFDNVALASAVSESEPLSVEPLTTVYKSDASSLDGVVKTGDWGLESSGENSYFSDSPNKNYRTNTDTWVVLPEIIDTSGVVVLKYDQRYDIENAFDLGFTEVSTDGGKSWQRVAQVTNKKYSWSGAIVDVSSLLSEGSNRILFRFRLVSDHSQVADGWGIDNIEVLAGK